MRYLLVFFLILPALGQISYQCPVSPEPGVTYAVWCPEAHGYDIGPTFRPIWRGQEGKPVIGPFSVATNHTDDLAGIVDTRPGEIGDHGAAIHRIEFHPPAGYRTRILRVYGDFVGWLRRNPSGNCVGALWGLSTTAPEGSIRATPAADNTFLYVQDSACGDHRNFRTPVDFTVKNGGLLGSDNVLISKVAVFWNETGQPVHLEPSFILVYQFEKVTP